MALTLATLADTCSALATKLGNQLRDSVVPRLIPLGGVTGQMMVRTSGGYGWADVPAAGSGPSGPAFSPASASSSFVAGTAKTVDVATVSGGTLVSIAGVSPALPAGLSASVVGGALRISGTAAGVATGAIYTITGTLADASLISFILSLAVSAAPLPAFSPTSGSQTFVAGTSSSVDLATVTNGTLVSIASVTPALPTGLTASVVGGALHLAGTASAAVASTSYAIVGTMSDSSTKTFTLTLLVNAAAAGPFTPANLAQKSTMAWHIMDDPANTIDTTNGTGYTIGLADKAGNGRDAVLYDPANMGNGFKLINTLNGRNVGNSDGGWQATMKINNSLGMFNNVAGATSIYLIRRNDTQGAGYFADLLFASVNGADNTRFGVSTAGYTAGDTTLGGRRLDTDTYQHISDATDRVGQWCIVVAQIDYTTGAARIEVNGTQVAAGTLVWEGGYGNTAASDSKEVSFGGGFFKADTAERLLIPSYLSTSDVQKVVGYLASPAQWNLQASLPSDHPYKSVAP